jgi:putative tryptophan/tyrosine transport system substrate-binding protein
VKRRAFITLLCGAAAAWPLAARAQQRERVRRIGILMPGTMDDTEFQARVGAFLQELALTGWAIGRNVRIDARWATANVAEIRKHAAELAALAPDVILAHGASTVGALLQATRTVPIVFPVVSDPVAAGFVDSLARPGGNATGFMVFEYGMAGKWLELLKEVAPNLTRAAVLRDPDLGTGTSQFAAIQAVAPSLRVEVRPVSIRDAAEIERAITAFARSPNGGLVMTASGAAQLHRDLIVTLASRHRLPAVYYERFFVAAGGLISYGPDYVDQYRQAAHYVDRILKGEKPADLPVQAPTKYELVINLKTAKALGLEIPPTLARARRRGDRVRQREFITLLGGAAARRRGARGALQRTIPPIGIREGRGSSPWRPICRPRWPGAGGRGRAKSSIGDFVA